MPTKRLMALFAPRSTGARSARSQDRPDGETPARYQGRLLPRPDEELVDQGLAFDLATLFDRRQALTVIGLGATGLGLAACASDGTTDSGGTSSATASTSSDTASGTTGTTVTDEIPEETNGPYPADGTNGPDILEESGVVRSDIRSSFGTSTTTADGIPMTLQLTIADLTAGAAGYAGAAVYVWHCDRDGNYSMYSDGVTDENYLRGVQVADDSGKVTFTSIFPACYSGRWPHIHFEVYPDAGSITDHDQVIATSQVALPQDVCDAVYATAGYEQSVRNLSQVTLSSDNVFGDDSGVLQLATVSGDVSTGYTVSLVAAVDATTAATVSQAPAGGGGGPQGGPPSRD